MTLTELIPVLKMAIGPVVLLSGVGLLLLSLTNRLGRVIDRGRNLALELRDASEQRHQTIEAQLNILSRRARLLQLSIIFAVLCMLLAALLVITLFIFAAANVEDAWLPAGLFVCAMASLFVSLVYLIQELNQALKAFRLDIGK